MNKPTKTHAETPFQAWTIWAFQGVLLSGLVLLVLKANLSFPKQITVGFIQGIAIISALLLMSLLLIVHSVHVAETSQD